MPSTNTIAQTLAFFNKIFFPPYLTKPHSYGNINLENLWEGRETNPATAEAADPGGSETLPVPPLGVVPLSQPNQL